MRGVIYPTKDLQELADGFWCLSSAAVSASVAANAWPWDGFDYGPVQDFLDEYPPSEQARAHMS